MKYAYYPGCSLERSARSYHTSTVSVAEKLGLEFQEVEDWNCCGATEYVSLNLLPAYALVARNLALASRMTGADKLVAPCSACYVNLRKTDSYMQSSPELTDKVNEALEAGELHYKPGSVAPRHLLEVMLDDVGLDAISEKVTRPLEGLKVLPYYGCLVVRPTFEDEFDDPEYPMSLDRVLEALGAEVVEFSLKAHCCGGHMTQISKETALEVLYNLLNSAQETGAHALVTLCPMCQLNLDAYQDAVNKEYGSNINMPILYFTQLMGLAFGMTEKEMDIGSELVSAKEALGHIGEKQEKKKKKKRRKRRDSKELPMPSLTTNGETA